MYKRGGLTTERRMTETLLYFLLCAYPKQMWALPKQDIIFITHGCFLRKENNKIRRLVYPKQNELTWITSSWRHRLTSRVLAHSVASRGTCARREGGDVCEGKGGPDNFGTAAFVFTKFFINTSADTNQRGRRRLLKRTNFRSSSFSLSSSKKLEPFLGEAN